MRGIARCTVRVRVRDARWIIGLTDRDGSIQGGCLYNQYAGSGTGTRGVENRSEDRTGTQALVQVEISIGDNRTW